MKLLRLLFAAGGLLLASPILPAPPAPSLPLDFAGLASDCPEGCTFLARGDGAIVAAATPPPTARPRETFAAAVLPPPPKPAWTPRSRRPHVSWKTAAPGGVRVVVVIPEQKAYVFAGGALLATSRVSTGKAGHETPLGTFRVLEKAVTHHSNIYSNAPMPFMQRLTSYGVALHAGRLPGYPASHGCIRLPWGFAKRLYGLTDYGTTVVVTKRRPGSARGAPNLS